MIELGTWKGRSLCSIADVIKRKKIKVYGVDTFEGSFGEQLLRGDAKEHNIKEQFKSNIEKFGIEVEILAMTTNEASEKLKDIKFDLVFIDADHTNGAFKQDLDNWLPKCKGIIAGHDYELNDISQVVDKVFPNVDYTHCASDPGRTTMWWRDLRKEPSKNIS